MAPHRIVLHTIKIKREVLTDEGTMKKVVWGVLSTARIGTQKVLPGMQKSPWCEIRAIASRDGDTARKAADALRRGSEI